MEKEHEGCCRHGHGHGGARIGRIIAMTIGGIAVASLLALVFGWAVTALWNWLMPNLFGFKLITYWQAVGLVVLAKLIFGSFCGHHRGRHPRFAHHNAWHMRKFHDDDWDPADEPRNWRHYRAYWKEQGKKDFEKYLREAGHIGEDKGN